jgi:hypothetical protein
MGITIASAKSREPSEQGVVLRHPARLVRARGKVRLVADLTVVPYDVDLHSGGLWSGKSASVRNLTEDELHEAGAWKLQIAREMRAVGVNVDLNRLGGETPGEPPASCTCSGHACLRDR